MAVQLWRCRGCGRPGKCCGGERDGEGEAVAEAGAAEGEGVVDAGAAAAISNVILSVL
jgi:hypothetical protein